MAQTLEALGARLNIEVGGAKHPLHELPLVGLDGGCEIREHLVMDHLEFSLGFLLCDLRLQPAHNLDP